MTTNRILIIDDEASIGQFVEEVASRCGYEAYATTKIDEFRQRLQSWQPSHVILDLDMPDADGIEVLGILAATKCSAQILIMSGFEPKVLDSARQIGVERGLKIVATVRKPMRLDTLRTLLEGAKLDGDWLNKATLAKAVESGELGLVFQPKFKLPEGGRQWQPWELCAGFEALIRWHHPTRGTISPVEFIPLAESVGLMDQLTQSVFNLAIQQLRHWNAQGWNASVSVNVSAQNLYDINMANLLANQCQEAGVSPKQITIELTETAAMHDAARAMDILTRLRIKGFKLSMDDFGTGYSSFIQLQRMPFSEIKIDQAFVTQCHQSQQSRIIVKTIIDVAHNLSLSAVAEGVEDEEVLRILEDFGCDMVQGYLTGRPVPADQCDKWMASLAAA